MDGLKPLGSSSKNQDRGMYRAHLEQRVIFGNSVRVAAQKAAEGFQALGRIITGIDKWLEEDARLSAQVWQQLDRHKAIDVLPQGRLEAMPEAMPEHPQLALPEAKRDRS